MSEQTYQLTIEQLERIKLASRPVPYLVMNGMLPSSPQQNANHAWQALGEEMGFDWESVRPSSKGERYFTAAARSVMEEA